MQISQRRILSFTSTSACARSRAYSGGARSTWNASRVAVFSPMPGSLASSRMSRPMGSPCATSYLKEAGEVAAHAGQRTHRALHRLGGELLRLLHRLVEGGGDQIFEHADILGVDDAGIDLDRLHFQTAGHLDGDHAAAGRSLDDLLLGL